MKKIIVFLFISIFLVECKKKDTPVPTLEPLSYFPVYPGSFWKYLENDTDTVVWNTSSAYVENNFRTRNGRSDPVNVPLLNGKPIYQYNKIEYIANPGDDPYYEPWPILSEQVGFQFEQGWYDPRYPDGQEKLIVAQKTVNPQLDSIIVLKGHWTYYSIENTISYWEYTKNIGLTSHIIIDTVLMDTTYKLKLLDYHINK